jgi:hypothetical protein
MIATAPTSNIILKTPTNNFEIPNEKTFFQKSLANNFKYKLPPGIVFKPQRTQIYFANGSTIESFPNNPETIRRPTLLSRKETKTNQHKPQDNPKGAIEQKKGSVQFRILFVYCLLFTYRKGLNCALLN